MFESLASPEVGGGDARVYAFAASLVVGGEDACVYAFAASPEVGKENAGVCMHSGLQVEERTHLGVYVCVRGSPRGGGERTQLCVYARGPSC